MNHNVSVWSKQVRALVSRVMLAAKLPRPLTAESLLAYMEDLCGRDIVFRDTPPALLHGGVVSYWQRTSSNKNVMYIPHDTTRLHRKHNLQHEYGHVLMWFFLDQQEVTIGVDREDLAEAIADALAKIQAADALDQSMQRNIGFGGTLW